jgi:hypothetical protein
MIHSPQVRSVKRSLAHRLSFSSFKLRLRLAENALRFGDCAENVIE